MRIPTQKDMRKVTKAARFLKLCATQLAKFEIQMRGRPSEEKISEAQSWRRPLFHEIQSILALDVRVVGDRPPVADRSVLVVSNHRCGADILVIGAQLDCTFLSRHDVAGWPLIGQIAKYGRTLFVDREDSQSGAKAIRAMRKRLRAGGESIAVFPEGATFAGDEVHPFKQGTFLAAVRTDALILPVALAYEPTFTWEQESFLAHLGKVAERDRLPCVLAIGTPFVADANAKKMAVRAENEVRELVGRARAHWNAEFAEALA